VNGAILDYNDVISLINNKHEVYYSRAQAFEQLNNNNGALADYSKAIEIDATIPEYYLKRGLLKMKMHKKKSAKLDFDTYKSYSKP
jgi:tetratricopeptide (TPR) repeat protein